MKQFNKILNSYISSRKGLIKVRLKVDPRNREGVDYRSFDGYEGYILREGESYNVILLETDLPVMRVPFSIVQISKISDPDKFDQVKYAAIKQLKSENKLSDRKACVIKNCKNIDFFEQYLRAEGMTDFDIKNIYKKSLFNISLSEKVNWNNIRKVAKVAGKAIIAPSAVIDDALASTTSKKIKERATNIFKSPNNQTDASSSRSWGPIHTQQFESSLVSGEWHINDISSVGNIKIFERKIENATELLFITYDNNNISNITTNISADIISQYDLTRLNKILNTFSPTLINTISNSSKNIVSLL